MSDYRTFVVPYDFSAHSKAALATAADLARKLGADLHLFHAVHSPMFAYGAYGAAAPPPMDLIEVRETAAKSLLEVANGIGDAPGKVETHVVEGSGIADLIGGFAEEIGADLSVMGTHGRTGLAHVFLGSVAERTLRRAPCPVLTVQAPERDERD